MMGVYIKGMEMPDMAQAYTGLIIGWDGKVYPFIPPQGHKLGESVATAVPVPEHGRLIAEADAIETAWMILTGLGYRKEENPQLEQTVREVFATAPGNEVD